jgi:hypothetical protein
MANPFDKFDAAPPPAARPGSNPFDKFESGAADPKYIPDSPSRPPMPLSAGSGSFSPYGAAEAGLSVATGIPAALTGAFAGVGGKMFGRDPNETARSVMEAMTFRPRTEKGREYLGNVGSAIDKSKLAGLGPTEAMGMSGQIAMPPRMAARTAGAAIADSPEMALAGRGAQAVKSKAVDPQTAALAQKAQELGFNVPPDMLSDNKFLRILGQASRDVPLSGSPTAQNRAAFNRAIIKTFGGDEKADKLSPQVYQRAMDKHGKEIGAISDMYDVFPQDLDARLGQLQNKIRNETPDVKGVIDGYIKDMRESMTGGTISGETWGKLRGEVTKQMRREESSSLQHALSELDDMMLDAISAKLTPDQAATFNRARRFYANGKLVGPLIGKAAAKGRGDMSPAALAQRVTSGPGAEEYALGRRGDLGDVAAVGSRFLTEPGSSNTAERGLVYGGLGGSAWLNPALAGGIYGAANLYNRFGPALSRRMIGGNIPAPPR